MGTTPAPRDQVVLFTETLDDAIPQNHPIRLLERCPNEVDWTFWENRYDGHRGQPPIHPRLVAGCILYGLMRGLRTTRTLEDAAANRLDFTWLLERRTIGHSTFADFRVEFKKEPKDLNRQIGGMVCESSMDALLELVVDGADAGQQRPSRRAHGRGAAPPDSGLREGSGRKDENPEKPEKEVSGLLPPLAIRAMPREV